MKSKFHKVYETVEYVYEASKVTEEEERAFINTIRERGWYFVDRYAEEDGKKVRLVFSYGY